MESNTIGASITARLRSETAEHHQQAESRLLEQSLARGTLPLDRYVALLGQRRLIHATLEPLVAQLCDADERLAGLIPSHLYQTARLDEDLRHLGADARRIAALPATAALLREIERLHTNSPIALLGVFYVFEGSKNGSHMLARVVRRAYALSIGGTRYFDPHGEGQRAEWASFKQRMDAAGLGAPECDAIVRAAQKTFELTAQIDDELMIAGVAAQQAVSA